MSPSITIFGATGSIGRSALRVIRSLGSEFDVYGLSCFGNLALFKEQLKEFRPAVAAVGSDDICVTDAFKDLVRDFPDVEFLTGADGLIELARGKVDITVSAIVGSAGLLPTLEAIPNTKRIALANKETLVMGGEIVKKKIREHAVELIPVDSEHSAVFTLLENMAHHDCSRILLTASGGSLRDVPVEKLTEATPAEALAHPTWDMGKKITIDSATLMNKGLEVIEAHFLFEMSYDAIDVVIHPESVVHSMVETTDGGIHAFLSVTDMALPIQYALLYPEKRVHGFGRLDMAEVGKLTFRKFDPMRYPALDLCYEAGKTGGTMPAVLNAANEVAVQSYLDGKIKFTEIVSTVEKTMGFHTPRDAGMQEILDADAWAREKAYGLTRG